MAELAANIGYTGVEFLPTHRFVYEMWRYGRLLSPASMIRSGHRDWRFDRVMEAMLSNKPEWWYQLKNTEDWLFPPSRVCQWALTSFQAKYRVPISVMWFGDVENFSPVMLELWDTKQGVDQVKLIEWLKLDDKNRSVVVDTAKIVGWAASNEMMLDTVLEQVFPYIGEVHYRAVRKGKTKSLGLGSAVVDSSDDVMKWLVNRGYRGRVVVEYGWPDLDEAPFGWVQGNLDLFQSLHHAVIARLHNF